MVVSIVSYFTIYWKKIKVGYGLFKMQPECMVYCFFINSFVFYHESILFLLNLKSITFILCKKHREIPSFTFRLSFQLTCQPHAMWKWSWLRKNKSSHVLKKKSKLRKFPRRSLLVKNLKPVNKSQPFIYKLHLCLVFSFSSNIFNLTFYYYHGFVSFLFFRFQKRDFLYELLTDVSFLNQKWI